MTNSSKTKDLSLYIHIPFCKAKCHYCAFTSFTNKQDWIPLYIDKLIEEIEEKSKLAQNYQIETIYIGGGTPSMIAPEFIKRILDAIKSSFQIIKNPEITIESNPESLSSKKIEQYLLYGVNRFSVGCQSLNNKTLRAIGRIHSNNEIMKTVKLLHLYNIKNFSLDFIMGLPHQTLATFKKELQKILSWHPPHLSFYFLSLDTKRINKFIDDCPPEDTQVRMYEHLTSQLSKTGYHHYEVSNYAIPGYECRHNLRYWQQKEYLGIGMSAHSYFKNKVFYNTSNFDNYINRPGEPTESFTLNSELSSLDSIMLSLRTSRGIELQILNKNTKQKILKKATSYIETAHLKISKDKLHATEKGFLILNKITNSLTTN